MGDLEADDITQHKGHYPPQPAIQEPVTQIWTMITFNSEIPTAGISHQEAASCDMTVARLVFICFTFYTCYLTSMECSAGALAVITRPASSTCRNTWLGHGYLPVSSHTTSPGCQNYNCFTGRHIFIPVTHWPSNSGATILWFKLIIELKFLLSILNEFSNDIYKSYLRALITS